MKEKNKHIINRLFQIRGIDVSKYDEIFLYKSLQKRIAETGCDSEETYFSFWELNNNEAENFVNSLQINYSSFFRNPLSFAVLENIILLSLIQEKKNKQTKEIRIWTAACAAGQETYSLAMLLEEHKNNDNPKTNYRIFATDKSEEQINKAKDGLYVVNALNNLSLKRVNQWFTKEGDIYTIKPDLKKNIDFSVFDLFDSQLSCPPNSIYGDFDIIMCANLLFYYKPEFRKTIIEKITDSLVLGGYLITGEAERDILLNNNYKELFSKSAIFMKT